ncbi:multidrug MFS transporter [Gemmatimonadetes bacterium T265]|nr:multidrug MFS transporter [Gemmatimonadetes bacterium T265]
MSASGSSPAARPAAVTPFVAHAPQAVLDDLTDRIRRTRWLAVPDGAGWSAGTDRAFLQELAAYWADGFDWRAVEAEANAYPNFTTDVDGARVHFVHVKGRGPNPVPLLLTHGWPGSFLEMLRIIPLLTAAGPVSFDVVIPSVLGFGYSGPCAAPGCDSFVVATVWHRLMRRLGYDRYGVQGGDIGAGVGTWLALTEPDAVLGLHLNYIPGSYAPYRPPGATPSSEAVAYAARKQDWTAREGAYAALHGTKPLTAAYGLNDSPVGLCAWIVEKFYSWSDHGPDQRLPFTPDALLANVTLYWVTQSIYTSMAIYRGNARRPLAFGPGDYVRVPTAFAQFPRELPTPPRAEVEQGYNIRRWTAMPAGGHFAAMEQPGLLADDLAAFFSALR